MTEKTDLYLRAFGMSGAQISSEMRKIEREKGVTLRTTKEGRKARKHEDYANFEQSIRDDASWMSEYYEIFYCLEVSIRKLINDTLSEAEGADWWNTNRVAVGIKNEVQAIKNREEQAAITLRSDNPIDYTTFGQLSQIITDNFDLFVPIISSKSAVSRVLNQLNLLRGPIAHCCPLAADERDRLKLAVRDWFRLLS
ncbi:MULTISPECIES: Swt1 family HEPN domain-containing protein [unclassified Rhizobium]|uniref:Swt1 family HEPN domain-containing protein n=1 Tax=unclassified Rhizobium TaxID=2613769 RepID=UPI0007871880|nr:MULTISPECIES: Swt1 family HEPN domain-containing protein [unclassified Rhizobium]